MSKASSNEIAKEYDDDIEVEAVKLPQGMKNYMTIQGYHQLRGELRHLLDTERPQVVETVSWAASNGDRSENGDYIYGKKRLREIDRRLRFLTKRLEIAEVVDAALQPNRGQVVCGATASFINTEDEEHTITIVRSEEHTSEL